MNNIAQVKPQGLALKNSSMEGLMEGKSHYEGGQAKQFDY